VITHATIEGCRLYAAANRSDPFAYNKALSHTLNGITEFCQRSTIIHGTDNRGNLIQSTHEGPANYTAQSFVVLRRDREGNEYYATEYRNVQRP
jgi:hypothetical protein